MLKGDASGDDAFLRLDAQQIESFGRILQVDGGLFFCHFLL